MSTRILVTYASITGSTGEVAEAIGEIFTNRGAKVYIDSVKNVENVGSYDAAVIGSSIRVGRWLPEANNFLVKNREILSQMPVAYFTTCLTMVANTEEAREVVLTYLESTLQKVPEITPLGMGLFAGSLDPQRQLSMQVNSTVHGDYRDWETIKTWAEDLADLMITNDPTAHKKAQLLRESIISYVDEAHATQTRVDLHSGNLAEIDLRNVDLRQSDLHEADFSKANLAGANLIGTDLRRANLSRADLSRATLNGANLSRADLSFADLSYADLNWSNLSEANLHQADLSGTALGWADLSNADLSQTNVSGTRYNHFTKWPTDFPIADKGGILVG